MHNVGRIGRLARDMDLRPSFDRPALFQREAGFFFLVRDSSTTCLTCQTHVPYANRDMETWKEFEANELTHSAAHHLLAIYAVGSKYGGWARVSDIARQLDVTRGSVSINLRALKKRGWVKTDEHHMVALSPEGTKIVQVILAKRVVVKAFLVNVLGVPEPKAEIDSCKVEHLLSDESGHRLVRFMRFLSSDPITKKVLTRFRTFECECPDSRACAVCQGRCLMDELDRAI